MNKAFHDGRLTTDPRTDKTKEGSAVFFTLANENTFKSKDGKKKVNYPEFVCYGQSAKFAKQYLKKGSGVIITSHVNTYPVKDEKGKQVDTKTQFVVEQIEFPKANKKFPE